MSSPATRRLQHDLRELSSSPVSFASAQPASDDNLLLWHGNLVSPRKGHVFSETPIHFAMRFTDEYPTKPPTVTLFTQLPHSNVNRRVDGTYTICLDMLETGTYADPSHKASGTFPYSGWSTAYTVKSILMQLQSFLLDKKLDTAIQNGSIVQSQREAEHFECQGCPHAPTNPWPIAAFSDEKPSTIHIERPFVKDLLEIAAAKAIVAERLALSQNAAKDLEVDDDGFVCVKGGKKVGAAQKAGDIGTVEGAIVSKSGSLFSVLEDGAEYSFAAPSAEPVTVLPVLMPQLSIPKPIVKVVEVLQPAPKLHSPVLTKTALKNKKRNQKRSRKHQVSVSAPLASDTPSSLPEPLSEKEEFVAPPPPADLAPVEPPKIGPFALVPYDVLLGILNLLPVKSILVLSQTCKFFGTATEDGFLWKHLYHSLDSKVSMKGASLGDWKHVYRVQMTGVVEDLRCFHRKVGFKDAVLGIPIDFTVNPVKGTVDYIHSTMDLLSHAAYREDQVRKTVWSETFTEWMPVYLSYDHFQRGLPLLKKSLVRLSPHIKSNGFDPVMVLEVLPKLMNTQIVLLADNGLHNSDAFLTNYFQIHRLFVAMVYEFPQLKTLILKRVQAFAKDPSARTKSAVASLGDLIPLVAVLPDPMKVWKSVGPLFLKESMERNVLWACRSSPKLAKLEALPVGGEEPERIKDTFEGSATALKLWATHVSLFKAISSYGSTNKLAKTHDLFYGRPTNPFLASLKADVTAVLGTTSFEQILPLYHLPQLPFLKSTYSPAKLTHALRQCVQESLRKGYHTKNTNFSKIHASGVSKILRKGQSYRCAPNTKSIVMEESWGVGGRSSFLDATAFLYDFDGGFVELVDYAHTSAQGGAVNHSGDVIRDGRGSHRISIDTKRLSDKIQKLVFTMTSWTSTLKDILDPEVRLFDGDSLNELCRYGFDECASAGGNTCVVMCVLGRERVGAGWKVDAVGRIGRGTAMDYGPVQEMIGQLGRV
ncbi:hypothetical protein HDU98_010699 [Podochytrium sp. JEL0797]|nr:hypothetical protein HDU98_010699 [Podochytrium sp. JEL0797]